MKISKETLATHIADQPMEFSYLPCLCGIILSYRKPSRQSLSSKVDFTKDEIKMNVSCFTLICPNCFTIHQSELEFSRGE